MARLIDADALTAKCGEWYTEEGTEEGFIGTLESLLNAAPTIPAILVEWLNNKMLDLQNKDKALSKAAWLVLYEWQKEQEAR